MAVKTRGSEPESSGDWVENELRDTKARLHKLEGELEQALKQMWSLEADGRRLTEAVNISGSASTSLAVLREEVRQINGQIGKIQDRQSALANRIEEVFRQRQTETSRDRQDYGQLSRDLVALGKNIEHYESRLQAMEETYRRVEETVAGNQLADQALERHIEGLSTRTARAHEAALRVEHETARVASEVERVAKDSEAHNERAKVLQEQLNRLSERIDKLESIAAFPEEARELLQRANFEREQLAQRILLVERLSSDVTERLQDFLQSLGRLEQRTQTHGAELVTFRGELTELAEQSRSQLKRIFQVQLRQRRRQHEAIAQEIKELSQGDLQGGD